ncbi:MAG: antitoxin Xre-like helix-turn-helix domain-containing protein [Acidobacteriota bacterium]|nr:antitoxin Xre-like helix-turn-helix domain-containing protein [Acidobacteriota bacterium]
MATAATDASARSSGVLTRAVVRAAQALGLAQKTLAAMLGVSEATVSRLARGRMIDPRSKEGELAVLFVRLFRSLDAMVGGDVDKARLWMHAGNRHLDGTPVELIRTVSGLLHVTEYLDALRGKS